LYKDQNIRIIKQYCPGNFKSIHDCWLTKNRRNNIKTFYSTRYLAPNIKQGIKHHMRYIPLCGW